jgi:hypothetical protein
MKFYLHDYIKTSTKTVFINDISQFGVSNDNFTVSEYSGNISGHVKCKDFESACELLRMITYAFINKQWDVTELCHKYSVTKLSGFIESKDDDAYDAEKEWCEEYSTYVSNIQP